MYASADAPQTGSKPSSLEETAASIKAERACGFLLLLEFLMAEAEALAAAAHGEMQWQGCSCILPGNI